MGTIPLDQFEKEGRNAAKETKQVKTAYQKVIDILTLQPDPAIIIKVFNYVMKEHPSIFVDAYEAVTNKELQYTQTYHVWLTKVGPKMISTIKAVRAVTNWDLKAAKQATETAGTSPVCLIEGVKEEMGNEIVESFKSIGS